MTDPTTDLPDPPDAPEIERRIRLHRSQWLLIPLFLLLPLLALLGVFGEAHHTELIAAGPVQVSVRYPTILRYKLHGRIDVQLHNRSAITFDTITIALDTAYARQYTDVTSVPPFTSAYEVDVADVRADERFLVRIEMIADRHGSHDGDLTIIAASDTARVRLSTRIFP
jgi:hypothetical protein